MLLLALVAIVTIETETRSFDIEAFEELNQERFRGALVYEPQPNGDFKILAPRFMSNTDVMDAIMFLETEYHSNSIWA